jgi:Rps23 Pro-64 3,4-dihydroxylase Tpa1-like proline 4-hydroxylase
MIFFVVRDSTISMKLQQQQQQQKNKNKMKRRNNNTIKLAKQQQKQQRQKKKRRIADPPEQLISHIDTVTTPHVFKHDTNIAINLSQFDKLYLRRDVRFTCYQDEKDTLIDSTPTSSSKKSIVNTKTVEHFIQQGFAVHVKNLDWFHSDLSSLLHNIDQLWKGQGGSFASVTYCPEGVAAYPPFSESNDKLIVQIEGSQTINIYLPKTIDESSTAYTYYHHGPNPIIMYEVADIDSNGQLEREITLKAGDVLYVPKDYILFCDAEKNSLDVSIGLSSRVSIHDYLNTLVTKTITSTCSSKHVLPSELQKYGQQVLQQCHLYEDAILKKIQARCLYSRVHFNLYDWTKQYNLRQLLKQNDGLVKISNFLPLQVAQRMYDTLESINETEWQLTEATENVQKNNINHAFMSSRSFPNHDALFSIFRNLIPELENTFSAGRYTNKHYIDPHDDRQYKEIDGETYSREIALIYYLTPDWKKQDGGSLIDMNATQEYVPEFNSLISFTIPRWHKVEPCLTEKPRYSIFGWFLQRGQLYDLNNNNNSSTY